MQIRRKRTMVRRSQPLGPRVSIFLAIDEMMDAKRAQRLADKTVREYQRTIVAMGDWLEENLKKIHVSDVTERDLLEYIAWMTYEKVRYAGHPTKSKSAVTQRGLSPESVNNRIRYIKSFFNWCVREGYLDESPAEEIKFQKTDTDKVKAYTKKQVRKLLAATERNSFAGFRDYVIMLTLLDTGLRIAELMSVDVQDVDFYELIIRVHGENTKNGKTRDVPISPEVAELLTELVTESRKEFGPAKHLFCNFNGGRLHPDSFDDRLKLYAEKAELTNIQVSAHCFRHTFAVMWIKNGGDPFSLQKILGHSDLTMVRRYIRLANIDVKGKHEQYSPVRNLFH